jgi:dUTP pyrophosphatase
MTRVIQVSSILSDAKYTPTYGSVGAAGADVYAALPESVVIKAGERALIPTGVRVDLPEGYQISVRPRSGLAAKKGVTVLNTPGLIDPDYQGEIKVILFNSGSEDFTVEDGDRIAQITVEEIIRIHFQSVSDFRVSTERGENGFGSTGTK